ncbi:MAG: 5'/3'-nucleotidase SurE [Candidatus Brocadiae bacterium]|nr:5'/3'-nucleotidase SurE [Candidatus Brocadiia bacterium]
MLTNDDGPFTPGICSLRKALTEFGQVTVVCPAQECSAVGHAITYIVPVRTGTARLADGTPVQTLTGTPADCVKFALLEVYDSPPDLLVSGPNVGINAGIDLFYSGTVAAALEGGFNGVPSVAFSTARRNADRADAVAQQAVRVLRMLLGEGELSGPHVFNVNIPHLTGEEPPIRFTGQDLSFPPGRYVRAEAPLDRVHYWLDSTTGAGPPEPGSDVAAAEAGSISITPLRCDLTDEGRLDHLRKAASSGPAVARSSGPGDTGGSASEAAPAAEA